MLSYKDPVAAAARKYKPIQSAVPGTTLGPIQIDASWEEGYVVFIFVLLGVRSTVINFCVSSLLTFVWRALVKPAESLNV